MVTDHGDMNGASYSASCSSSSSPAGAGAAAERIPSVSTASGGDVSGDASQAGDGGPAREAAPEAGAGAASVEDEVDSEGSEREKAQVRKVRRKTKSRTDAQVKKRNKVRAQVMLSDINQAIAASASSLYELLPQDAPGGASNDEDLAAGYGTVKSTRGRKRRHDTPSRGPSKGASRKEPVTYLSQISSQNGIKLRIKKTTPARKPPKQRNRKRRPKNDDTDSEDEGVGAVATHTHLHRRSNYTRATSMSDEELQQQSKWGDSMPVEVLHTIFKMVTHEEGCVPFLVR